MSPSSSYACSRIVRVTTWSDCIIRHMCAIKSKQTFRPLIRANESIIQNANLAMTQSDASALREVSIAPFDGRPKTDSIHWYSRCLLIRSWFWVNRVIDHNDYVTLCHWKLKLMIRCLDVNDQCACSNTNVPEHEYFSCKSSSNTIYKKKKNVQGLWFDLKKNILHAL